MLSFQSWQKKRVVSSAGRSVLIIISESSWEFQLKEPENLFLKNNTQRRAERKSFGEWMELCVGCVRGVARECRVSHLKTVIVMQMEDDDDVEVWTQLSPHFWYYSYSRLPFCALLLRSRMTAAMSDNLPFWERRKKRAQHTLNIKWSRRDGKQVRHLKGAKMSVCVCCCERWKACGISLLCTFIDFSYTWMPLSETENRFRSARTSVLLFRVRASERGKGKKCFICRLDENWSASLECSSWLPFANVRIFSRINNKT